jgi:hypothetical protein
VSYVLLVGAIILEVSAIFMGFISSYWSYAVIKDAWKCLCCCCWVCLPWYWYGFEWASGILQHLFRHHPENRGEWSGNLAQYNLIGRCIQGRKAADTGLWEKMLQNTGIKGNTTLVVVSPELKKMVLDRLLGVLSTP